MNIVITTISPGIDAEVDPRFGRGAYFLVVDSDTLEWQAEANPAVNASGGAGVQAAQIVVQHGAQVAISGDFGPNAYDALAAAGVQMFLAPAGESLTASELLARYQRGELKQVTAPTGPGHHTPGTGRGRGRGRQ
jgi:predicted Fe-Mo cluster-binding NifX family protein